MLDHSSKIYVAGHRGMVGSALVRALVAEGYDNIVTRRRDEMDLRDQAAVRVFFEQERPEYVFLAAARVGGIRANMSFPADFLYDNLMIQNNVIIEAFRSGVRKLCFLGSSCVYPRDCPQPMSEKSLFAGPLEPTNEGYALAKIAGLRLVQYLHKQYGMNGIVPIPCNLYGPNDSFDPQNAHVLSSLVKKFTDAVREGAAEVSLWGTGSARREFMHVDDCARACLFLMRSYDDPEIINVGPGSDVSIKELAEMIAAKAGFAGTIRWDTSMPDGMPLKCMDVSRMSALGFSPRTGLPEGIDAVINEYRRTGGYPSESSVTGCDA